MNRIGTIEALGEKILGGAPDPVVCYRLLRDVLRRSADSLEIIAAKKVFDSNRWVQLLAAEQHEDGGWGRFHSANHQSKQKIPTTEAGVERALTLGEILTHLLLFTPHACLQTLLP